MVLVGAPAGPVAAGEHAGPVAGFEVAAEPGWEPVAVGGQVPQLWGLREPVEQLGSDPYRWAWGRVGGRAPGGGGRREPVEQLGSDPYRWACGRAEEHRRPRRGRPGRGL